MRKTTCLKCAAEVPLGESFGVFGNNPMCEKCANEDLAGHDPKTLVPGSVTRNTDPSVCSRCGTDWGSASLATVGGAPMCSKCVVFVRNYPFPRWIKMSAAAVAALVALSFVLNARYFLAYADVRSAGRLMEAQKVDEAAQLMTRAAGRVPGVADLASAAAFYRGVSLLSHDKSAEAERELVAARATFENDPMYQQVLLGARIGVAFDRHDYDAFLQHSLALLELDPKSARSLAGVASAYACKYAVTGSEEFRVQSLDYLSRAKQIGDPEEAADDYFARIQHRLSSREIITAEEYRRRFGAAKGTSS